MDGHEDGLGKTLVLFCCNALGTVEHSQLFDQRLQRILVFKVVQDVGEDFENFLGVLIKLKTVVKILYAFKLEHSDSSGF